MKPGLFSRFGWYVLSSAAFLAGVGGWIQFQNLQIAFAGVLLSVLALLAHAIIERRRSMTDLKDQQAELRAIVDGAVDAIITIDERGIIQAFNAAAERIFGYRTTEVLGRNVSILMPPAVAVEHDRYIARYLGTGERRVIGMGREVEGRRKDGTVFPLELSVSESRLRGRRSFTGIARDIAERRQAAEALRRANEQLAAQLGELEVRTREITLLGQMGDLLQSALEGKEAYRIVVDYAHQLFPGTTGALCVADVERRLVEVMTSWGEGSVGERVFAPEDCWALRNGRPHWVEGAVAGGVCAHTGDTPIAGYACLPMTAQGEILGTLHLRVAVTGGLDAARRKLAAAFAEQVALALANLRLKETLRRQAIRDPLTGLYNRRYLEESLDRELRRAVRKGTPVGVLMLDLDHFKIFNDTHGHGAGDSLLRALAEHIQSGIRAEDIACRYGGEEFALIFPDATLDKAAMRAEQIRESARKIQVDIRGQLLGGVTVSIGVAALPNHGSTAEALLRASDTALYSAKAQGRDRVIIAAQT
jgi:diguanylate cyclase (GGDEF)-like protein/PAS domain S-box-containing protein